MQKKRLLSLFIIFAILALLLTGCDDWDSESEFGRANVSPLVEQWRDEVTYYAEKYGVSEYVELLLAIIAQESGGDSDRYPDVMQSSESMGLPPNSISDPKQSIEQGVKYFSGLVIQGKEAGVDTDTILQAYNFGGGYIGYIASNYGGKHSEAAARAFSSMMAGRYGYSSYGDVLYVQHVRSKLETITNPDGIDNFDSLEDVMNAYMGVPYVFGGESKSGIDCSALMQVCYRAIGYNLPRVAQDQYNATRRVSREEAVAGDMVFFTGTYNAGTYITHVGIYLGNNQVYHASSSKGVCKQELSGYLEDHLAGFGRL